MIYDLIIIGGGPSGLTAGIYGGRATLDVLIIEKEQDGGQIKVTSEVVNYPGIAKISGIEYMNQLRSQAKNFGVEFLISEVIDINLSGDIKKVTTLTGEYKALSIIIATGASPRKLNFPGEKEYTGRGVAYCATCDGEFFTGKEVFVIGAGFAAAEEAIFLTKYASKVTVIAREPEFTCAKSIANHVLSHPKIKVEFNTELLEATGDTQLKRAKFRNNLTNQIYDYSAPSEHSFGIFVFVGYEPQSKLFKDYVSLDSQGFVLTNDNLETSIAGVYAAGDIRPKKLRQLVTAVSDGALAAVNAEKYAFEMRSRLDILKDDNKRKLSNNGSINHEEILDNNLRKQLSGIVERFENSIEFVLIKDSGNSLSDQMENMLKEITSVSDKLSLSIYEMGSNLEVEHKIKATRFPTIAILDKNKEFSGIKYSALPSGHELNSFILAMYNIAGPGQKITENLLDSISMINSHKNIKIGISLTCTKCPESVQSAQKIAATNKNVTVEVIDVFSFIDFKEKHGIMSVPALIIDDSKIFFGEKSVEQILEYL
ncbi:FAD-dependent oxidoreductase [Fusobacterium sp. PH5-44]|uniref:FAD-dependent oxidoreductase n=1 Tax=unclassified Fusobacterium TaxID=2648384 RepID=UPI003D1C681F